MLPDPDTERSIRQQIVDAIASSADYVQSDEEGFIMVVQDGFWFRLWFEAIDNGEPEPEPEPEP
jgi:hypothetical protein